MVRKQVKALTVLYLVPCQHFGVHFAPYQILLVMGTGIGGIILNGKVLMGAHAAAGEVSCLVSNMVAMEAETFEMDKVETFSDAPLWAGAASATGLIREYRLPARPHRADGRGCKGRCRPDGLHPLGLHRSGECLHR